MVIEMTEDYVAYESRGESDTDRLNHIDDSRADALEIAERFLRQQRTDDNLPVLDFLARPVIVAFLFMSSVSIPFAFDVVIFLSRGFSE